jgi:hypothetical protein
MVSGRISESISRSGVERIEVHQDEIADLLNGTQSRSPVTIAVEAFNAGFDTNDAEQLGFLWEDLEKMEIAWNERAIYAASNLEFNFQRTADDIWDDLIIMDIITEGDAMPLLGGAEIETFPPQTIIEDSYLRGFIVEARTLVLREIYDWEEFDSRNHSEYDNE